MNFFDRQNRAKQETGLLYAIFIFSVAAVCFFVWYISACIYNQMILPLILTLELTPIWFSLLVVFLTLVVIFWAKRSIGKKLKEEGGMRVAEKLGARQIDYYTKDLAEKQLMNVVREMAIASGVLVPQVFVLEEESINAFAAGNSQKDAIVCVTTGALKHLNRDELQAVVAHEFSHILNEDMSLNMRMIALIGGVALMGFIGLVALQIAGQMAKSSKHSSSKDSKGAAQVILVVGLFGLLLYIAGYAGTWCGSAIQAALNRRRETLADASATQFTRNPLALASALKKVGGFGSRLKTPGAREYSHLYFANGVRNIISFSSHPPIEERIRALEPNWDGKFINVMAENGAEANETDKINTEADILK